MFQFAERTFNKVALTIDGGINEALVFAIWLGRDVRPTASNVNKVNQRSCVIATIGNNITARTEADNKFGSCGFVGGLAGGK